ncbi:MAG: hypothetical protein M3Z09_08680 [Acidobacteriota bacterium]|nr:hypothetical protein [Acidobacteriota bacterium]
MDLDKIIRELQEERSKLDQIVSSLEELQLSSGIDSEKTAALADGRRGRRFMDAAAREEVSKRMKKYWANRKKNQATS